MTLAPAGWKHGAGGAAHMMDETFGGTMDKDKDLTQRGTENEVEGKGKELKGRVRDGIAGLTGDDSESIKGKAERVEGKAQQKLGETQRKLDDNV